MSASSIGNIIFQQTPCIATNALKDGFDAAGRLLFIIPSSTMKNKFYGLASTLISTVLGEYSKKFCIETLSSKIKENQFPNIVYQVGSVIKNIFPLTTRSASDFMLSTHDQLEISYHFSEAFNTNIEAVIELSKINTEANHLQKVLEPLNKEGESLLKESKELNSKDIKKLSKLNEKYLAWKKSYQKHKSDLEKLANKINSKRESIYTKINKNLSFLPTNFLLTQLIQIPLKFWYRDTLRKHSFMILTAFNLLDFISPKLYDPLKTLPTFSNMLESGYPRSKLEKLPYNNTLIAQAREKATKSKDQKTLDFLDNL